MMTMKLFLQLILFNSITSIAKTWTVKTVRVLIRISMSLDVGCEQDNEHCLLNSPFEGRDVSSKTPKVMFHCTSGWSLRWFKHYGLVGIVGTLCGWRVLSTFAKGARNDYHDLKPWLGLELATCRTKSGRANALENSAISPRHWESSSTQRVKHVAYLKMT